MRPNPPHWQGPAPPPRLPVHSTSGDALALLCEIAARSYDPEAPQWDFSIEDLDAMMEWEFTRLDAAIDRAIGEGLLDQRVTLPGDRIVFSLTEEG